MGCENEFFAADRNLWIELGNDARDLLDGQQRCHQPGRQIIDQVGLQDDDQITTAQPDSVELRHR